MLNILKVLNLNLQRDLFQHNLLRKLLWQIWKLAEESVFLNTIFQTKNFHEMYRVY